MVSKNIRILVTGGGTGGHVSPALAVVRAIDELSAGQEWQPVYLYVGSKRGIESKLAREAGLDFVGVESGKLRRAYNFFGYFTGDNIKDIFRIPVGVCQSLRHVWRFKPDVILSTGGYVSVPPVVAGWFMRVPVITHEQTVQIGLANRISAFFARRIALTFEGAADELPKRQHHKTFVTGNPVKQSIFGGNKKRAVEFCGFSDADEDLPCIYITGGVQGARILNRAVEAELGNLLGLCRVIHQCGRQPEGDEQDYDRLARVVTGLPDHLRHRYRLTRFVNEEIADVLALADLVVSRAGAGTVTEVSALGKPAVFVPLVPTGGDEQTRNARRSKQAGAAVIIPQNEFNGPRLLRELQELLGNREHLAQMGEAALTLARPEAARDLAQAVIETGLPKSKRKK